MSRLYYFLSERRNQFMSCLDEHGVCSDVTLGINGVSLAVAVVAAAGRFWDSHLHLVSL